MAAHTKSRRQSQRHSPGRRSRTETPSAEHQIHVGEAQCRMEEVSRDDVVQRRRPPTIIKSCSKSQGFGADTVAGLCVGWFLVSI